MLTFLQNTDIQIPIYLIGAVANVEDIQEVSFDVKDRDGNVLVSDLQAEYTPGEEVAYATIPAIHNELAGGQAEAYRVVFAEIALTGGSKVSKSEIYHIALGDGLVVGFNSFCSMVDATIQAHQFADGQAFLEASDIQKVAALKEAKIRLCLLRYSFKQYTRNQNVLDYQDFLNHASSEINLNLIRTTTFAQLPEEFRQALIKAQVAEAIHSLSQSGFEQDRMAGVVSKTVGESRTVYRLGRPLELPVCKRALTYVARYVTFNKRVGRA